jgi:hypothetical protein
LFYLSPLLRVKRVGATFSDLEKQVNYEDNLTRFERTCLILASKGFCSGNPENVANCKVSWVLKMMDYHKFTIDFKEESQNKQ